MATYVRKQAGPSTYQYSLTGGIQRNAPTDGIQRNTSVGGSNSLVSALTPGARSKPATASDVTFAPTITPAISGVRMAIIGNHTSFYDSITAATRNSQSSTLRNIFWIQIKFPPSSETTLRRSIDDRELEDLTAAIILIDDWITELHTFAAHKCGHRGLSCLFVQSKSNSVLDNIAKTWDYGVNGYKEDVRGRLQRFGERLNIRKSVDMSSIYLINNTSLLLAALHIWDASIVADEMLLLSRLDALASGYK